jgi:Flp pilus assembly protein CpaB
MNPRQRRGVLLVVLAALGMIGVFIAISAYVSDVRSEVDPKIEILQLTEAVEPAQPMTEEMVELVEVPERYAPEAPLVDPASTLGTVSTAELPAGTYLQEGMLEPDPAGGANEREISILVNAETGVAGRISPGDLVDIVATFGETEAGGPRSTYQVERARIVAVGLPERVQEEGTGGTLQTAEVVPVTFALSAEETLQVAYAESFAQDVRLALLSGEGADPIDARSQTFQLSEDGGEFSGGEE